MLKTCAFTLVLLVFVSSLMASGPMFGRAALQERVLENGIRPNVPLKFNIKEERKHRSKI